MMANTKNPPMERGPKTDNAANKANGKSELKSGDGFKAGKKPGGKR